MKSTVHIELENGKWKTVYSKLPNGQLMKTWYQKGSSNVFFPIGYSSVDEHEFEEAIALAENRNIKS